MVRELFKAVRLNNLILLAFLFASIELFFHFKINTSTFQNYSLLNYINILITAAFGYVINDSFDKKSDLLNEKLNKSKLDSRQLAQSAAIFLLFSIVVSLIHFNKTFFILNLIVLIGLFLYSWKMKHLPLLGNLTIASFAGLCPLIGYINHPEFQFQISSSALSINEMYQLSIPFLVGIMAFLSTLSREIVKDLEDIDGDLAVRSKTLPILFGKSAAKIIALIILICTASLTLFALICKENYSLSFTTCVCIVFLLVVPIFTAIVKLIQANSKADFFKVSNLHKFIFLSATIVLLTHTFT